MTRLLQEKDDQCRHIATVLQTKNAEWKSIKMKLTARKQRNKRVSGAAEGEDEVEVVIEQGEGEENRERDRQHIIVQPTQSTQNLQPDESYSELLDECTQLPTKPPSPRTPIPHPPIQTAETQSHLDALIDLISDGDETEDVEPTPQKEKENTTRSNINSSFTMESSKIQKRKSHARGCSCCDKVQMNDDLIFVNNIYFLVLLGYTVTLQPR